MAVPDFPRSMLQRATGSSSLPLKTVSAVGATSAELSAWKSERLRTLPLLRWGGDGVRGGRELGWELGHEAWEFWGVESTKK